MKIEILGAFIVHPQNESAVVKKKNLYIKDGLVYYEKPFRKADKTINAEGKVLFPGLVNAHHHIYSTLSKGVPCDVPFKNFTGNLKQLWWTLDHSLNKEDMILSSAIACKESIKQGVTTVFDHHISGYTDNSLSDMAQVFDAFGISGTLAFELSDRNGEEFFLQSLKENIRFAEAQKNKSVQGMMGLHASFTLSNKSLQKIAEVSGDIPIHVHVAEGEIDGIQCHEKYKMGLIERFDSFDLLRDNSLLIHCSNLTDKDLQILKQRNLFLVQAVDSNLNNGLNVGNISRFLAAGLKVTVGTDGMHSSAFKAYKNSLIFTKYLNKNCDLGYSEMNGLFLNSFKLKKAFGLPLGIIAGEAADIAIFDYIPATPFNTEQFLGHFIFGITESACQYVIKKDEILLDDFHVTKDLYKEQFQHSWDISQKMFNRFEKNKNLY
ncbi:MAG: hypothetical protein APR54_06265 [Candidatus Cloacimonas sp. SDB]|nr:MAG: hypothetical protein APR54_06265 [Candidatus Cloacimonas sp. SDB]